MEEGASEPPWPTLVARPIDGEWSYRAIETYLECPRRYYYEFALELSGGEESSPYLKFQSALHATLSWMRETTTAEERCNGLGDRFREDWARFGPQDDAFAVQRGGVFRRVHGGQPYLGLRLIGPC